MQTSKLTAIFLWTLCCSLFGADEKTALDLASKTVLAAKVPADLDTTISELAELKSNYQNGSRAEYKWEGAHTFACEWQSYLAAQNAGNFSKATAELNGMLRSQRETLIPRSEIIRQLGEVSKSHDAYAANAYQKMSALIEKTQTLADLKLTLTGISQLSSEMAMKTESAYKDKLIDMYYSKLAELNKEHQNFMAGLPVNIKSQSDDGYGISGDNIARLRAEFLTKVFLRAVGAPEDSARKSGETLEIFVNRHVNDALEKGNVGAAISAMELWSEYEGRDKFRTDARSLWLYAGGLNQENAKQYSEAVITFQQVLKMGSSLPTAKIVGEHLDKIKADYPEQFEAGMERIKAGR